MTTAYRRLRPCVGVGVLTEGSRIELDGPRAARPDEVAQVVDLTNLVFCHLVGGAPRIGTSHPELFTEANRGNVRLIRAEGRVVSALVVFPRVVRCVGPSGPARLRLGGVAVVATHPDYRRRGLSRMLLSDAAHRMRDLGCHLGWLGTGIPAFYRPLGWEHAGSQFAFELDGSQVQLLPAPRGVQCAPAADLAEAVREVSTIWAAEPLGSERDTDLTRSVLDRWRREIWIGRRERRAAAYAVFDDRGGHCRVLEHAGDPAVVAALLGAWWRAQTAPQGGTTERGGGTAHANRTLSVDAAAAPAGLADILLELGLPHTCEHFGMLLAVGPRELLEALGCQDASVAAAEAGTWAVRVGAAAWRLSPGEFVRWVFGTERVAGAPSPRVAPGGAWPARFHLSNLDQV